MENYFFHITALKMNAIWLWNFFEIFKKDCVIASLSNTFPSARVQKINDDSSRPIFLCDKDFESIAIKKFGWYETRSLSDFNLEIIEAQWNKKFHWDIDFYFQEKDSKNVLVTIHFASCFPGVEIEFRPGVNLGKLNDSLPECEIDFPCGRELLKSKIRIARGLSLPLADPRFDALWKG